jgi:hypothetical protein
MSTTSQAFPSDTIRTADTTTNRVVRDLIMTPAASELLTDLAKETGTSESDVLRMAVGLLKAAVDARKEGKHLGIAGSPEGLDIEFIVG